MPRLGASPIYIIGKYLLGVYPTSAGYKTFEVKPHLENIQSISATLPLNNGSISINKKDGMLEITPTINGGTLIINNKKIILTANQTTVVKF